MNTLKSIFSWIGRFLEKTRTVMLNISTALILIFFAIIIIGTLKSFGPEIKDLSGRVLIIDPKGEVVSSYDKINLFDVFLSNEEKYIESKNYDSGKKINLTKLPWGNLGMTICYDLRFPLLYKKLAKKGAHFFLFQLHLLIQLVFLIGSHC